MSGEKECSACEWIRKDHGMERQEPLCTGRAGCLRAAGTEGGADSGATPIIPDQTIAALEAAAGYRSGDTLSGPAPVRAAGTEGGAQSRHVPYRPVSFAERAHVVAEFAGREPERHMANYIVRARSEIARLRAENERMEDAGRHHASELRLAVLAERARHYSEITRLRAEVDRWKERAHLAEGAVAVLNRTIDDLNGDRDARDLAVAKAALDMAAGKVETWAMYECPHPVRTQMNTLLMARAKAEADALRAIDPEAVRKGMEDGR